MTHRYARIVVLVSLALLAGGPSSLSAQEELPYTLSQLVRLVESGAFSDQQLLDLVQESCIGFDMSVEAVRRLRNAGASEDLLLSLRDVCVRLTAVVVSPSELEIPLGGNGILRARAILVPDSAEIPNVDFTWSSEDTTIADVTGGVVVAKRVGETGIVVETADGHAGFAVVRVRSPREAADSLAAIGPPKSVGTAAGLGIFPGGGEFYVGNTAKGAVVLGGAAAALAAGFLLTSEDTISVVRRTIQQPSCTGSNCSYEVETTAEVEETDYVVVGAAVAGAFWLYGLIDGIMTAKKSQAGAAKSASDGGGLSLEIAPRDGIRVTSRGEAELTLIRIRS
jgi:hypothetical protein